MLHGSLNRNCLKLCQWNSLATVRNSFSTVTDAWYTQTDTVTPRVRDVDAYILGQVPYEPVWKWQQDLIQRRVQATAPGQEHTHILPDLVMFLEHDPVFTLGRGSTEKNLKFDKNNVPSPFSIFRCERGGQVTYHGPGQLVVYPILNLSHFKKDLHWYVNTIEEIIIQSLAEYGLTANRIKGLPGVWVKGAKVAQVGMNVNRWHTMHGFAINVHPDMSHFQYIIPCGIEDRPITNVHELLQQSNSSIKPPSVMEMQKTVMKIFQSLFHCKLHLKPTNLHEGTEVL